MGLFKETLVFLKVPWKHYIHVHCTETNEINCFVLSFKVRLYVNFVVSINIINIKNFIIVKYNSEVFIGPAILVYELIFHALQNDGKGTCQLKIYSYTMKSVDFSLFWGHFQ